MRRLELATAADPRASVVAVSAVDAAVVRRPSAVVVPNGVDLPSAVPARPVDGDLLFVGALDYEPNREALAWYADEIFGKLPASLPPLTAVGRGGPAALGRLSAHPALRVVGEVPDVGPYLAAASVVVVPLRSGGGSRIKVLEAAAWQRPIVATHKAVEGLPMLDGVHAMLADEPAAFAAALQRVHSDHALAESITASAQLVAAGHAWPAVADRFVAVVEELRRPVPGMTAL
jgi:glycosyltransferase involved in cell wall biosynthesis